MWIIYKHTSIDSGKSYIGLTKTSMNKRWIQHKSDAKTGSRLHFHNAIRLYGVDNWEHEIIEKDIPTLEEANRKELEYIKMYNTFEDGYNLTIGGDGVPGLKWTKEKSERLDSKRPVYKFIHYKYGIEELTLKKMCEKYNMSKGTLHGLINGAKESYYGWQMYAKVGDSPIDYSKDSAIYTFYHKEYTEERSTIAEFANKYNFLPNKVLRLVQGKSKHLADWSMRKFTKRYETGINNPKSIIRNWYNKELDKYETLPTSELCRKYELSTGTLTMVVKGKRKSHKGWTYIGADAEMKRAKGQESLARADLYKEQADQLAVEFVKETSGQNRREHEEDKEFDAAVMASNKESSKVQ